MPHSPFTPPSPRGIALPDAIVDDTELSRLRLAAWQLREGIDWSRQDEHALIAHVGTAVARGVVPEWPDRVTPMLYRLPDVDAPAPAPPAAPAKTTRPAAAEPPAQADTTFTPDLDVAAMVATLVQAAKAGVPFCEECARRRADRAVAAGAES